MENKTPVPRHIIFFIFCALLVAVAFIGRIAYWLAWVSILDACNNSLSCDLYNIKVPTPVLNDEIIWTQEMENKRLEALEPKKVEKDKPKEEKQQEKPKETKVDISFDLDKLAKAVAIAETGNCTKGYGKTYSNCFWIKSGKTAPCPKVWKNKMCIYEKPEDSYKAFKIIWSKWYRTHPNLVSAQRWTGHDNAVRWLSHVNLYYNKL